MLSVIERAFTGDVEQEIDDGNAKIRVSIVEGADNHRVGSFSFLLQSDTDLEDLATQEVYRVADVNDSYKEVESQLMDLIDENCGYNPYEPLLDVADQPSEDGYDIVFHDSITVFD